MTLERLLNSKSYQHIGYLFYAIAAADEHVCDTEIDTLKKLVKRYWLPLDHANDQYGSDAAFQIEIVFDWLHAETIKTANECYGLFENYYDSHSCLFTSEVKHLILETSNAIANSFAKKNKSELILLAKLSVLFKN